MFCPKCKTLMTLGICPRCKPKKFKEMKNKKTPTPKYFKTRRHTEYYCPECHEDPMLRQNSRLWRMGDAEDEQWNAIHDINQDDYILMGYEFFCNACGQNYMKKYTLKIVTVEKYEIDK